MKGLLTTHCNIQRSLLKHNVDSSFFLSCDSRMLTWLLICEECRAAYQTCATRELEGAAIAHCSLLVHYTTLAINQASMQLTGSMSGRSNH